MVDYAGRLVNFTAGDAKQSYTADGAEFDLSGTIADLDDFDTPDDLDSYTGSVEFDIMGSEANHESLGDGGGGVRPDIRDEPMLPRREP